MVTKKLPLLRLMVVGAMVSLLAGCATMRYGGAPEPTFDLNKDIEELSLHYEGSNSIVKFYENPTVNARDEFIVGRLTLMNLRYLKFIRNLTSERQLLDSATAITALGLGLAGSMVPLAQTKAILAAVAAGLTGTKEVIDKNYYFQKTIPALVAQMNAERQKALYPLVKGMQENLKIYPFAQAVVDLNNYYNAGTFTGAIDAIQTDAAKKEDQAKEDIKELKLLPKGVQDARIALVGAIAKIKLADHDKIKKALTTLGKTPTNDFNKDMGVLHIIITDATDQQSIDKVRSALKTANIGE